MATAKAERTRARILDAAFALSGEKGYADTKVRDIAERAGCATSLLYRYFPQREALVLAWTQDLSPDARHTHAPLTLATRGLRLLPTVLPLPPVQATLQRLREMVAAFSEPSS